MTLQPISNRNLTTNNENPKLNNQSAEVSNNNKNYLRDYNEDEFGEEEDPEWVDIDVKEIEKNKINFQPVPKITDKINIIQKTENFNSNSEENTNYKIKDLNQSEDKDSNDGDDALNRLGKISSEISNQNEKNKTNIYIESKVKDICNFCPNENNYVSTEKEDCQLLKNGILEADKLFEIEDVIFNKNLIDKGTENFDNSKKATVFNFDSSELQNSLGNFNFLDIFINDKNNNKEGNINSEVLDDALIKNLFISNNNINNSIFNNHSQSNLLESSPDKQNILLKTLNYGNEIQKNILHGAKDTIDMNNDHNNLLDSEEQRINFKKDFEMNNDNNKTEISFNNSYNNSNEINRDLLQKFTEHLKMRGITSENLNAANFDSLIFNTFNPQTLNINNNLIENTNNNIVNKSNDNQLKNLNSHPVNNRMNLPPNFIIPNLIPAPNMFPYPIINRDMMMNNMIQQGLLKPNLNMNSQRTPQNLTPHQIQYLDSLKSYSEREKIVKNNSNKSNKNTNFNISNSESQKEKSIMHQNFLENPITVVEKNLVKKGWAIMDEKNTPSKFLNSIELQNYLESEKRKNNLNKLNFICDYESDMYFKPADLLEELEETMPNLLENLKAKNQQPKNQTVSPLNQDMRLLGIPIVNPIAIQSMEKENPAFKVPGMPINLNPMMVDQRIINMNMMPPFPHMSNLPSFRTNNLIGINNINNNFNGQSVNMNINLQFVNNDIKLNNIMLGNNTNLINKKEHDVNLDVQNINNNRNFSNINHQHANKKDSIGTNNPSYNMNMIPNNFNKNNLNNIAKSQNIPPGYPINQNFQIPAMNNMFFSTSDQNLEMNNKGNLIQNNNIINFNINNNPPQNQNLKKSNNYNNLTENKYENYDNLINFQNENLIKNELNSFFGSNVFYETVKKNTNDNIQEMTKGNNDSKSSLNSNQKNDKKNINANKVVEKNTNQNFIFNNKINTNKNK